MRPINTIISDFNQNLSDWRTRSQPSGWFPGTSRFHRNGNAPGRAVYFFSNTRSFPERKSVTQSLPSAAVFPFVRE